MQSAFWGPKDHLISPEKVRQLPYASMYVQLGENPQALMILVWSEPTLSNKLVALKWLSANHEMLVTQSGRVIKTVNLKDGNLTALTSNQPDPLSLGLQRGTTPHQWHYQISWLPGYHSNYKAISTFTVIGQVSKQLPAGTQKLLYVREQVDIPILRQGYQNRYWLEPQTGKAIASEQYIFPGSGNIKLMVGKPYAGENHR
jgi:hypothetical protein